MASETSDIDDQCGSNAEVTRLSEKSDIIVQRGEILAFTALSYNKLALLIQRQLCLYKLQKKGGQDKFVYISRHVFATDTKPMTLTNVGSTNLVVLCDEFVSAEETSDYCNIKYQRKYCYSLLKVFSIETGQLRCCFDMKTDIKKTDETQQIALAYGNENLAICMTNPLKLEILNTTTCLSESVNVTSFATEMFPAGDGQPFLTLSNADGQTHVYISLAAGGGMRKLTKVDRKGHILATFIQVTYVKPGPIAAVGDGTFVFGYNGKLLLMSEDLQILATLASHIDVKHMRILNSKKGRRLYCVVENKISQYFLQ